MPRPIESGIKHTIRPLKPQKISFTQYALFDKTSLYAPCLQHVEKIKAQLNDIVWQASPEYVADMYAPGRTQHKNAYGNIKKNT